MYLAESKRRKDGKEHRYYRIVENHRGRNKKPTQRTLLYLGEINDSQKAAWTHSIDIVMERERHQIALFPEDRKLPEGVENGVQLRMSKLELRHPRQWGSLLAGHPRMGFVGSEQILARASAAQPQGHALVQGVGNSGELSADRAGKQMATAPILV